MSSSDSLELSLFIHQTPNFNHLHVRSKCLSLQDFSTIGTIPFKSIVFVVVVVDDDDVVAPDLVYGLRVLPVKTSWFASK